MVSNNFSYECISKGKIIQKIVVKNFRKVGDIEPFQKRRDTEKGGDNSKGGIAFISQL